MIETVLGFDYGTRKIGVAIGQTLTRTARPLTIVANDNEWTVIQKLIKAWQPQMLVVGLPLNMDGSKQPLTWLAEQFAQQLSINTALPVVMIDERLSTVAAREQLFAEGGYRQLMRQAPDAVAAQIILQDWLNQEQN